MRGLANQRYIVQPNSNVAPPSNTLFYGDCLRVLTDDIAPASVDLIYLDPPFNSKRDYNIPLGGKAQASVFQDTWVWSATQDESLKYVAERDASTSTSSWDRLLQFAGQPATLLRVVDCPPTWPTCLRACWLASASSKRPARAGGLFEFCICKQIC